MFETGSTNVTLVTSLFDVCADFVHSQTAVPGKGSVTLVTLVLELLGMHVFMRSKEAATPMLIKHQEMNIFGTSFFCVLPIFS